jgi:hypothetical protein
MRILMIVFLALIVSACSHHMITPNKRIKPVVPKQVGTQFLYKTYQK